MFSSALKSLSTSNISSNYSIAPKPSSLSGPWKIFDAKKKGTGKAISVFVFDRKSLDPQAGGLAGPRSTNASLKKSHEEIVERLKKEASSLARLRHPSILELAEPVEETRHGLMFATEPVTASLAGLLEEKTEQESTGGVGGRGSKYVVEDENGGGRRRREVEIDELEIQKGLLQVGKGLEFLHESARLVHANLTPEAIMINSKSDWKISGLGFSSPPDRWQGSGAPAPTTLSEILNYDARLPRSVQLNIDYTSPDFVLDTSLTPSADMFSLGLIIIAMYNSPHRSPIETSFSISQYRRIFSSSSSVPTQNNNFLISQTLPRDIKAEVLPKLITRRPAQRFSAREFQQAQYFDNVLVSTIRFLDALPAKSPNEKSQFMHGLPRILPQFPKSILERKILPVLLDAMKDLELLSLILQSVFKTLDLVTNGKRAFSEQAIPALRRVFLEGQSTKGQAHDRNTSKEGGLIVLLENMSTVKNNSTGKEFKDDIVPILYLALESPTHSLVDHALQTLPTILPCLDFSTIKNELFPVIAAVFSKTSSMAIKIQGLYALNSLCGGTREPLPTEREDQGDGLDGMQPQQQSKKSTTSSATLDKYTIQEKVVPLLKAIKTKEPAVMMAALAVFRQVGHVADADFLALEVLPTLWSFSLGPLLNLEQFRAFMTLIKSLSSRIETEQARKLQELSSTSGTGAAAAGGHGSGATFGGTTNGFGEGAAANDETDFVSLVTGRNRRANNGDLFDEQWGTETSPAPTANSASHRGPVAEAPRFSWSTVPAPASSRAPQASGTVTPDNAMSSLPSLMPSRPGLPSSVAPSRFLQPITPILPTSSNDSFSIGKTSTFLPSRSISNTAIPNPTNQGAGIDWSSAQNQQPSWSPTGAPQSAQGNSWEGASSNDGANPFSGISIAPPPASSASSTPLSNGSGGNQRMGTGRMSGTPMNPGRPAKPQAQAQAQASAQGQKQGMEKYESLI